MIVRNYWQQAAESIERLLRRYPINIHPDFALNQCEKKINDHLFKVGSLAFCESCDVTCTVNVQMKETIKVIISKILPIRLNNVILSWLL